MKNCKSWVAFGVI